MKTWMQSLTVTLPLVAFLGATAAQAETLEDFIRQNYDFKVCERSVGECRYACLMKGFAWIPNDEISCENEPEYNRVGCYCARDSSPQSNSESWEPNL